MEDLPDSIVALIFQCAAMKERATKREDSDFWTRKEERNPLPPTVEFLIKASHVCARFRRLALDGSLWSPADISSVINRDKAPYRVSLSILQRLDLSKVNFAGQPFCFPLICLEQYTLEDISNWFHMLGPYIRLLEISCWGPYPRKSMRKDPASTMKKVWEILRWCTSLTLSSSHHTDHIIIVDLACLFTASCLTKLEMDHWFLPVLSHQIAASYPTPLKSLSLRFHPSYLEHNVEDGNGGLDAVLYAFEFAWLNLESISLTVSDNFIPFFEFPLERMATLSCLTRLSLDHFIVCPPQNPPSAMHASHLLPFELDIRFDNMDATDLFRTVLRYWPNLTSLSLERMGGCVVYSPVVLPLSMLQHLPSLKRLSFRSFSSQDDEPPREVSCFISQGLELVCSSLVVLNLAFCILDEPTLEFSNHPFITSVTLEDCSGVDWEHLNVNFIGCERLEIVRVDEGCIDTIIVCGCPKLQEFNINGHTPNCYITACPLLKNLRVVADVQPQDVKPLAFLEDVSLYFSNDLTTKRLDFGDALGEMACKSTLRSLSISYCTIETNFAHWVFPVLQTLHLTASHFPPNLHLDCPSLIDLSLRGNFIDTYNLTLEIDSQRRLNSSPPDCDSSPPDRDSSPPLEDLIRMRNLIDASHQITMLDISACTRLEKLSIDSCCISPVSLEWILGVLENNRRLFKDSQQCLQLKECVRAADEEEYKSSLLSLYGIDGEQGSLEPLPWEDLVDEYMLEFNLEGE